VVSSELRQTPSESFMSAGLEFLRWHVSNEVGYVRDLAEFTGNGNHLLKFSVDFRTRATFELIQNKT
jgi:hypothetical protein